MERAEFGWLSADETVVTVDGMGLVTATGNGSANVTASSGLAMASTPISIAQLATAIRVSPAADTLRWLGDTLRLSAEALDANRYSGGGYRLHLVVERRIRGDGGRHRAGHGRGRGYGRNHRSGGGIRHHRHRDAPSRGSPRPGRARRPLQRYRRPELEEQRELADGRAGWRVVRSFNRLSRSCHGSGT